MTKSKVNTKTLVGLALFTAIVVVLQLLGSFIKFGVFSISLVLIPIVVGAAIYGWKAGAWLGLVFGVVVLISGDAAAFLQVSVIGTILTVLIKGTVAGLLSGIVFRLIDKWNTYVAVIVSAVVCPVVNSGIFLIGCELFFASTIEGWLTAAGFSGSVTSYIILVLIGGNFLFELLFNVVLSPIILRIINIGRKS